VTLAESTNLGEP